MRDTRTFGWVEGAPTDEQTVHPGLTKKPFGCAGIHAASVDDRHIPIWANVRAEPIMDPLVDLTDPVWISGR